MSRKNTPFYDQESDKLLQEYEAAKKENRSIYMDGDQIARIAERYASDIKFEKAQEVIDYGLQLHPENTAILVQQAYVYLDNLNLEQAIETASKITDNFEIDVKILKAEIALEQGRLDEANALLSTIEEYDPETISTIMYLYIEMGYATEVLPWLEKLQKTSDQDEEYIGLWADYYFATSQTEKAIELFNKLIDLDSYNPEYWLGLGKTYLISENFEKAIEACDFAIAADENYGEAYACRVHCYLNLGNIEAAAKDLQKTIELKALNPKYGYMLMGMLCVDKKEWESATKFFNQLLKYLTENEDTSLTEISDAYESLAMCALNLNDLEKTQICCNKSKEADPENKDIYLIEGQMQLRNKKYDLAKASFELLINESPDADTWHDIGCVYSEENLIEEAKNAFEKAYELEPEDEDTLMRLAIIHLALKDIENFRKYNNELEEPLSENTMANILSSLDKTSFNDAIIKLIKESKESPNSIRN